MVYVLQGECSNAIHSRQISMILYCGSTETEFLSMVVLNVISVQKFAGIFMKGLFRPRGEKKNPSTDICSTFKQRYFKCHLLWIQSSKQPDSTFSRADSQLSRQDFKKSLVPFFFLPQALKYALDFQNHSVHTSSHLGTDFQKGLGPTYKPTCWLCPKTFPCCRCRGGQLLLSSECNLQSWALGRRRSLCAHITLIITQSEPGQPFLQLWCYRVYYTNSY